MKRLIETDESTGLESLIGERVLLMCASYFYTGVLEAVGTDDVLLKDCSIVYATGPWAEAGWTDVQNTHRDFYVRIAAIESYARA